MTPIDSMPDFDNIFCEILVDPRSGGESSVYWTSCFSGIGLPPDDTLKLYAAINLPIHLARLVAPILLIKDLLRFDLGLLRNVCVWLICYCAIGLTGISFELGEMITRGLQWSYFRGGVLVAVFEIPRSIAGVLVVYDAIIATGGPILFFIARRSPSRLKDTKSPSDAPDPEGSRPDTNVALEANLENEVVTIFSRSARAILTDWRLLDIARLNPEVVIRGRRVLPGALHGLLIRYQLVA